LLWVRRGRRCWTLYVVGVAWCLQMSQITVSVVGCVWCGISGPAARRNRRSRSSFQEADKTIYYGYKTIYYWSKILEMKFWNSQATSSGSREQSSANGEYPKQSRQIWLYSQSSQKNEDRENTNRWRHFCTGQGKEEKKNKQQASIYLLWLHLLIETHAGSISSIKKLELKTVNTLEERNAVRMTIMTTCSGLIW